MKVAIIDSGVNTAHPHVRAVAGGIGAASAEGWTEDFSDRLGHGTAVAGVIREKAPEVDLFSVKVCDRRLSAQPDLIVRALEWCRFHGMDVINLSIRMEGASRSADIKRAVNGLLVVSATGWLPGSLPGVIAVAADDSCPRDEFRYHEGVFHASTHPRPGSGCDRKGIDFAVANMSGFAARVLPAVTRWREPVTAIHKSLIEELAALGEARPS